MRKARFQQARMAMIDGDLYFLRQKVQDCLLPVRFRISRLLSTSTPSL